MASEFGDRVKVVTEEYGNSEMARRFGVRRYPVVFVDDALVIRPKDFGFGGPEDVGPGLYVPWRNAANQQRFKDDLRRMVSRRLAGAAIEGFSTEDLKTPGSPADGPATLPGIAMADLRGGTVDLAALGGRTVIVDMWATWCPPCRETMAWLNDVHKKYGDRVTIVAVAVDSKPADIARALAELKPTYHVVMGTADVMAVFGEVAAVPKLFVFDGARRRVEVLYGAPPDLNARIDAAIERAAVR